VTDSCKMLDAEPDDQRLGPRLPLPTCEGVWHQARPSGSAAWPPDVCDQQGWEGAAMDLPSICAVLAMVLIVFFCQWPG
jgi:hypothetical protein